MWREVRMRAMTFGPNLLAPFGLRPMGVAGLLRNRQREEMLDQRLAVRAELRLVGTLVGDGLRFPQFSLNDPADRCSQVDTHTVCSLWL